MDAGMLELVERIFWMVSFIAIGGMLALMFLFIFAQSIFGSKTIHTQLEKLLRQSERISEHLEQIAQHLEKEKKDPTKRP